MDRCFGILNAIVGPCLSIMIKSSKSKGKFAHSYFFCFYKL